MTIMRTRARPAYLLLLPGLLIVIVFFLLPICLLLSRSFLTYDPLRGTVQEFTLDNYVRLLSVPIYGTIFQRTFLISILVTLGDLVLGYPIAYYIARSRSRYKQLVFLAVVSPLMVSIIIRSFGWSLLLDRRGLVNALLLSFGLIHEPLMLMYNYTSVTVGLIHVLMPYMVLTLSGCFQLIDPTLEGAAHTLGASKLRAFLTITFPLSMPGVIAGCVLVYILSVGAFATPLVLGGGLVQYLPLTIYELFTRSFNYPLASAMGATLLLLTLVLTVVYHRCSEMLAREAR